MGSLFGTSYANEGFNYLTGNNGIGGYIGTGNNANNQIAALLGLGGDSAAANAAFQKYLGSSGYKFNLAQGQNAINSNAAARGMLNSGATAKALTSYGQNLGSQYFNNYIGQLSGLASSGLNAAGVISDAGKEGPYAGELQANGLGGLLGMGIKTLGTFI